MSSSLVNKSWLRGSYIWVWFWMLKSQAAVSSHTFTFPSILKKNAWVFILSNVKTVYFLLLIFVLLLCLEKWRKKMRRGLNGKRCNGEEVNWQIFVYHTGNILVFFLKWKYTIFCLLLESYKVVQAYYTVDVFHTCIKAILRKSIEERRQEIIWWFKLLYTLSNSENARASTFSLLLYLYICCLYTLRSFLISDSDNCVFVVVYSEAFSFC